MNKTASFFLSPITAFFLPRAYHDAAKSSGLRGLLYIVYGASLLTLLIMATLINRASVSDEFIQWAQKEFPVVIWTSEGLSLENGQTTAVMTHPVYGPIAVFDQNKKNVTLEDMQQLFIFVTAKKIYFRKLMGGLDERDVTKVKPQVRQQLPSRLRITGDRVKNLYGNGKKTFMSVAPTVIFLGCFLSFLSMTLCYSLIGLLLNLMRTHKLGYAAIFNLTGLATGIAAMLAGLQIFGPFQPWPWPFAINLLISLIYLCAAFTLTNQAASKSGLTK